MQIEESIEISQPVELVFNYVADMNHLPAWSGPVVEVRGAPVGPLGSGDVYTTLTQIPGRTVETPYRATLVVAPDRLEVETNGGPLPHRLSFIFAPSETGTRMTQRAEGEPGNLLKLMGPMLEQMMRRQLRTDLATLKELLEQPT